MATVNGNGDQRAESVTVLVPMTTTLPLPRRCPKCKGVRWKSEILDEELALIDRLQDELYETGLIRESGERIESGFNFKIQAVNAAIFPRCVLRVDGTVIHGGNNCRSKGYWSTFKICCA